ncbi:MAG: hypothetical protein ACP5NY_09165 [Thermocladium sp.]
MANDVGLSLLVIGIGVVTIATLSLSSIPLLILGISISVSGLVATWSEEGNDIYMRLSQASWANVSMLLEGLGIASQAIYLPSKYSEAGEPVALIPMSSLRQLPKLPRGITVRYGDKPQDSGLVLITLGTVAVKSCRDRGAISEDPESTLEGCLVNFLSIAKSVRVSMEGGAINVALTPLKAFQPYEEDAPVSMVLGSPYASISAALIAEALGRPLTIAGEGVRGGDRLITLREVENAA